MLAHLPDRENPNPLLYGREFVVSEFITICKESYESTVKALVSLINENAELRAELSWFEDEQIPLTLVDEERFELDHLPRVFRHGDVIPADVQVVKTQPSNFGDRYVFAGRTASGEWSFRETAEKAFSLINKDVTFMFSEFYEEDFPLTEVLPAEQTGPLTYTLREAADLLVQAGIDTGQNRLRAYLNEGIAWTDAFGSPRGCAEEFLELVEPANPSRGAVVRVTPVGLSELSRIMNVAA